MGEEESKHMALVTDEFGSMVGLVTLTDVMEAIVGEFPTQGERAKQHLVRLAHGRSVLVDWRKHDRYGRIVGRVLLRECIEAVCRKLCSTSRARSIPSSTVGTRVMGRIGIIISVHRNGWS